jgi:hypothetical protein
MARTPKGSGRRRPAFESNLSRRPGTRNGRDRLLVVCGAKATEKDYLQGLVRHLNNPAVTVRIRAKACWPSQLVDYAVSERDRMREDFEQVWCVFDVDHFDVGGVTAVARRKGIEVAISNPCFELWLVLHFCGHTAYAATYKELLPYLKRHMPEYDKARLDFKDCADGWSDASRRAKRLSPAGREHETNPATGVWTLVDRMASR